MGQGKQYFLISAGFSTIFDHMILFNHKIFERSYRKSYCFK
ncbi:hypothetical protein GbCGDNIH4_8211 [Granulibacter bethesdensis CGDNIH4]|nr:hypothetical protein GbCGDNIH4_8211 [Granulibacter bethesdensis CGDNIH4]